MPEERVIFTAGRLAEASIEAGGIRCVPPLTLHRNRGPGVPEGERELIFERFYQVDDVLHHSTPGVGLGLYIAREVVDAHGGSIECVPCDSGAEFRFTILMGARRS